MNQTIETIQKLRTIHGEFSDRDVSEEDLKQIIEASVHAANASARQSYSIIIVRDRDTIKKRFDYDGSKALLFCVDLNRIIRTANYMGYNYNTEGFLSFVTGSTDAILTAQTAAIAAKSLGIDSMFTNSIHRHNLKDVCSEFGLPDKYCFPLITLILGYPEKEPAHSKKRLCGKGVIHNEKYENLNDADLEELIQMYDKQNMWTNDNWAEMGYVHYLDWFFTKWFVGDSTPKQRELITVLREMGFIE